MVAVRASEPSAAAGGTAAQRIANHRTLERKRRIATKLPELAGVVGAFRIQRHSGAINDAPKEPRAHSKGGLCAASDDPIAVTNSDRAFEWHGEDEPVAKANDFACEGAAVGCEDRATFADRAERAFGLNEIINDLRYAAHPTKC